MSHASLVLPPEQRDVLVRLGPVADGLGFDTVETPRGTLHGKVGSVRVSFLSYAYPLIRPAIPLEGYGCNLAAAEDLVAMKLAAIAQRGARRDFVDLRFLLDSGFGLPRALELYRRKFQTEDVGHLLVALSYFDDAETDPMPRMLVPFDWEKLKESFRKDVRKALE